MSKPFVLINLDKEYEFRLSNKALLYFEEITGQRISSLSDGNMGVTELNALIYAGLKAKNKEMTYEQVIDLIDEHSDMDYLGQKITEAMENSTFFKGANHKKTKQIKKK